MLITAQWKKASQWPVLNGASWHESVGDIEDISYTRSLRGRTVCVRAPSQSQLSWEFSFSLVVCLLSGHRVFPFNFCPPRSGYTPFWKLLSVSNFSAWLLRKKNLLIRKSSQGLADRLRQGLVNLHLQKVFHTCIVSAVWQFTAVKVLSNNNEDDLDHECKRVDDDLGL